MQQSVMAVVLSTLTPPVGPASSTSQLPGDADADWMYLNDVALLTLVPHAVPAARVTAGVPVQPLFVNPSIFQSAGH